MRFALFVLALYGLIFVLDIALLRYTQPSWWQKRWLRRLLYGQLALAALCSALWQFSRAYALNDLLAVGWGIFAVLFLYLGSLLIALLLTSPVALTQKLYEHFNPSPAPARRAFLSYAMGAVPIAGASGITTGIVHAASAPHLPEIHLNYPALPAALDGLRLLHISDIHIGPYIRLGDLEALLIRAEALQPDIVLVTGDMCDHMPDYLDALRLFESFAAPLGVYACLGNHEYIRGIRRVRRAFEKTSIPLLVDEGLSLDVDGTPLYLAAADDPRFLRSPESYARLEQSVERALSQAPQAAFTVLLSHRSQAFDYAAELGAELTLSGHTHGFQMGLGGRSLFESLMPERYIWGRYSRGESQLYTTCGVGHWLPFRFGCPPEAPLIVLHKPQGV